MAADGGPPQGALHVLHTDQAQSWRPTAQLQAGSSDGLPVPCRYNLFVRAKLESLKRDGTYAQFADSKVSSRLWHHGQSSK